MSSYHRCSHCRGFYETELPRCKFCRYTTVFTTAGGDARVFPDRETCRAIQIAEYEQLPPEAMADCFRPPEDELSEVCGCLHCGQEGPAFEAVEMRWMANEKMWACPCTTCGGRGFDFDIHPVCARWECVDCGKKWRPPDDNFKPSNCKCPVCGCVKANGWFDDEYLDEEVEAMTEEEYAEAFGMTRAEEEAEYEKFSEEFEASRKRKADAEFDSPNIPGAPVAGESGSGGPDPETMFDAVDEDESTAEDVANYDPEKRLGEDDAPPLESERMRDDIDFPHEPRQDGPGSRGEEDIPF
jgi:hypothetical protein